MDEQRKLSEIQGWSHRLKLRFRSHASKSLFARLHPSTARQLYETTRNRLSLRSHDNANEVEGWSMSHFSSEVEDSSVTTSGIEFIPLVITFSSGATIYTSYNGGDLEIVDGTEEETIELSISLKPSESDESDDTVLVTGLTEIQDATRILVEPLTFEDWELLETKASFLEEGGLLQQVSVMYPKQQLELSIGAGDIARVRVQADSFIEKTPWPEHDVNQFRCMRLVAQTEVIIAPKERPNESSNDAHVMLRVHPMRHDYSASMLHLSRALELRVPDGHPFTVSCNPTTLLTLPGWQESEDNVLALIWKNCVDSSSKANERAVVMLIPSNDVPIDHVVVHPLTRIQLNVNVLTECACIRLLSAREVACGANWLSHQINFKGAKIFLQKLQICEIRGGPQWRFPQDIIDCRTVDEENDNIMTQEVDFCTRIGTLLERNPEMKAIPIAIGALISLPCDRNSNALYRLQFHSVEDKTTLTRHSGHAKKNEFQFVYLRDLSSLLSQCWNGDDFTFASYSPQSANDRTDKFQHILGIHEHKVYTSVSLLNLLPETSIVDSSLLTIANRSTANYDAVVLGEQGSGKTHTALVIAALARIKMNASTRYLDCKVLKGHSKRMNDILIELNKLFKPTEVEGNVVIILDDLDHLAPNLLTQATGRNGSSHSTEVNPVAVDQAKLIGDTIRHLIEMSPRSHFETPKSFKKGSRVSIIITCRDISSLHQSVLASRPFSCRAKVPTLSSEERLTLLLSFIKKRGDVNIEALSSLARHEVERTTEGFRPRDIQQVAFRIRRSMLDKPTEEAIAEELPKFTPLCKLSVADEDTNSTATWSEVGGLFQAKAELSATIENPTIFRRIYEKACIRLPKGVVLFGPPGCGKSLLVPALANKCGFSLVTCRGPELLDRYIGASEGKVRELFERASAASPSILFLDEIDALAPRRGSDRTGVTDRIVNQLLTLLDGVEDNSANGPFYILAATSRPDLVDPALLRPGRLEKHIFVGHPKSNEEWIDLFQTIARDFKIDEDTSQYISSGTLLQDISKASDRFLRLSPADVKGSFNRARLSAIHETLALDTGIMEVVVRREHLVDALENSRPSITAHDHEMLLKHYRSFLNDRGCDRSEERQHNKEELRTALR